MANLSTFGLVGVLSYFAVKTIYRLFFHPLRNFPGPKLAAATSAYEGYFNVIKSGMFIWELQRLHNVYGPIVRIGPNEIHIRDSNYYDQVYASSGRRREKVPYVVAQFGIDGSVSSSITPETHRQRRAPLEKFFSKQSIMNMESIMHQSLAQLHGHLQRAYYFHKVVSLDAAFAGLTSDIIHKYGFGLHKGNLDLEDFNSHSRDSANGIFKMSHIAYFFPVFRLIVNSLPLWMLQYVSPPLYTLVTEREFLRNRVIEALDGNQAAKGSVIETLAGPSMPVHLRGVDRLSDEGFALVLAGSETTARSLSVGIFALLSDEKMRSKLREELRTVMPTPESSATWNQLEQLPYLNGIVMETLRQSTGIAGRAPRIAPTEALQYQDWVIPPNTIFSCTNYFVLTDPEIFTDPHVFDPERWMRAAAKGERLDRYLVNFSKGSRMCLGMNMAYAELYLTFAMLIRRYELELYDTTEKEVAFVRDLGTPCPEEGECKIKVLVKGLVEE